MSDSRFAVLACLTDTGMADSDAALLVRAQGGDTTAFELLARRYLRAAHLVASARMTDTVEAQDVCQDALVKAWEHIGECRDGARFGAWLLTIVRNTAHNRAEYLRVRTTEPLESGMSVASPMSSDHATLRSELRTTLLRALATLPPVQREVVLLHDLQGMPHGEIAAQLAISELMSRRHLSDARRALRGILKPGSAR